MPKRSPSGVKGLVKRHVKDCTNSDGKTPSRCGCDWYANYKTIRVLNLTKWSKSTVDPRQLKSAEAAFDRLKDAYNGDYFDPTGEVPPVAKADLRLCDLIDKWKSGHADVAGPKKTGLRSNSLDSEINLLKTGTVDGLCIGTMAVKSLGERPDLIKKWLDGMMAGRVLPNRGEDNGGRDVTWTPKTWNNYHAKLRAIFNWAMNPGEGKTPLVKGNPMNSIARFKLGKRKKPFHQRIDETIEADLFAACAELNKPYRAGGWGKLTQAVADQIRSLVEKGKSAQRAWWKAVSSGSKAKKPTGLIYQTDIAKHFRVSPTVVSEIVSGKIWNAKNQTANTNGDGMERRLIGAFDGGLRMAEMMLVQITHVDWRPQFITRSDGTKQKAYIITLPADNTKGGATHGGDEEIIAASDRFVQMLDRRRMQLKNRQDAYIFGNEDGSYRVGCERQWRKLFKAAGLQWGRRFGLVWHTTRAEFISRLFERGWDPQVIKEMARHRKIETTEGYASARPERKLKAWAGHSA